MLVLAYPLAQPRLVLAQMPGQPLLVGLLPADREQLRPKVRHNNQQLDLQVGPQAMRVVSSRHRAALTSARCMAVDFSAGTGRLNAADQQLVEAKLCCHVQSVA